jgi:hypothetical protein
LLGGVACSRRAPLSGFLNPSAVFAAPSSTALFHAAAVPELLPSERSPREDRAPLSRPLAPLWSVTGRPETRRRDLIACGFTDAHARGAVAWIPRKLWVRFHLARRPCFPLALGHLRRGRPRTPAPPTSKPSSLRESVRADTGCPAPPAVALLGFCPSSDLALQASEPRPARARRPEHPPPPEGDRVATQGTSSPPNRVKPNPTPKRRGQLRRQSPAHFWTGPRRLSATSPSPLAFGHRRANPSKPDLRSFKVPGWW